MQVLVHRSLYSLRPQSTLFLFFPFISRHVSLLHPQFKVFFRFSDYSQHNLRIVSLVILFIRVNPDTLQWLFSLRMSSSHFEFRVDFQKSLKRQMKLWTDLVHERIGMCLKNCCDDPCQVTQDVSNHEVRVDRVSNASKISVYSGWQFLSIEWPSKGRVIENQTKKERSGIN